MKPMIYTVLSCLVLAMTSLTVRPASAQETYVTIGTGGQTGVYYVVGQSICKLVNREMRRHGIKCTAPSTGGSVVNLNTLASGGLDMGVAQSDWQYHAYHGTSQFADKGPNEKLRSVFSVHPEPFTVVARADAGIATFTDVKGKRFNIGVPGSGQRGTLEELMAIMDWTHGDFALAAELKPAEMSAALCDNNIDAFVYAVGHPNGSIKEASTSCDAILVPVTGPAVDQLVGDNPYYAAVEIPGGLYRGSDSPTPTFGVLATFVSSTDTPADTVYEVVKAVFDNFSRFKRLHPAFENLTPEHMIKDGLSAPLHDGAKRYYEEKGWM